MVVRAQLPARAPEQPEPFEAVLADLHEVVTPALAHWQHPGWLAYFPAGSSPAAVLGELAAAGLAVESMMWSTSPAATEVESLVATINSTGSSTCSACPGGDDPGPYRSPVEADRGQRLTDRRPGTRRSSAID